MSCTVDVSILDCVESADSKRRIKIVPIHKWERYDSIATLFIFLKIIDY